MHLFYKDIFKKSYSSKIVQQLDNSIYNINQKYTKDENYDSFFSQLYVSIIKILFKYIELNDIDNASSILASQDELFNKMEEVKGAVDIKVPNDSLKQINTNLLQAYNEAMYKPDVVETIYFEALNDICYNNWIAVKNNKDKREEKLNILPNKLDRFKEKLTLEIQNYIQTEHSELKYFLDNKWSKPEEPQGTYIDLSNQLINIYNKYEKKKKELEEQLSYIYELNDTIKALNSIKNNNQLSQKEIQVLDNYLSLFINKRNQEERINNNIQNEVDKLNELHKQIIDKFNLHQKNIYVIENPLYYRLELLKEFENTQLRKVGLKQINAILNNKENKIRIYEILKYHIIYSIKCLRIYYLLLNERHAIKSKLNTYKIQNNYYDILHSQKKSQEILEELKVEEILEFKDVSELALNVIVYNNIKKGTLPNFNNKFSFWKDLIQYSSDKAKYSPLEVHEEIPKNFNSYIDLVGRKYFDDQWSFNEQFNHYRKSCSTFEAKTITRCLVKYDDTSLTEIDCMKIPKNILYFKGQSGFDRVMLLKIDSNSWVIASSLNMNFKIKKYDEKYLYKYPAFLEMLDPQKNFIKEYDFAYTLLTGGAEPDVIPYQTNTKAFPESRPNKSLPPRFIKQEKSRNLDSYYKFWEDFYGYKINDNIIYFEDNNFTINNSENKNTLDIIDVLIKDTLVNFANHSQNELDETSIPHKVAEVLIPFYSVSYKYLTDSDYKLNFSDSTSIVLDTLSIIFIFISAGIKISNILIRGIIKAAESSRKFGILNKRSLLIQISKALPNLSIEINKILIKSSFNLINPIPFVSLPTKSRRLSAFFRNKFNFNKDSSEIFSNFSKVGSLKSEWKVNYIVNLPKTPMKDSYFENIYAVRDDETDAFSELNYYIKQDNAVYQVEWDDYCHTWRVIPSNTVKSFANYKTPVKWDNEAQMWITHSYLPGMGGNPLKKSLRNSIPKENMINVSASEIKPLYNFLEKARQESLQKVIEVEAEIHNPPSNVQENINQAFDIFMGHHSNEMQNTFKTNLAKQKEALTEFNPATDLTYKGGFDIESPKLMFYTYDNRFYTRRELPRGEQQSPIITVCVDHMINIHNTFGYTKYQFKQYLSNLLLHEMHHATNKITYDYRYPNLLKDAGAVYKFDLDPICALPKPHIRRKPIIDIVNNNNLLQSYFPNNEKILDLIVKRINEPENTEEINSQIYNEIEDLYKRLDIRTLRNPDNTVFLIELLYKLFKNKQAFDKFVDSYKNWERGEIILWEYEKLDGDKISKKLDNSDIGKLNSGNLKPLTRGGGLYDTDTIQNINIKFKYLIYDKKEQNELLMKTFNIDQIESKFNKHIITFSGAHIKPYLLNNNITTGLPNKFILNNNINFIKLNNAKEGITAVRVALRKVIYGNPLIAYNGTLGESTVIYALTQNHFYAYYCEGNLINSLEYIFKAHKVLFSPQLSSDPSELNIQSFFKAFSNNYNQIIINYSGRDERGNKNLLIPKDISNIKIFQYDYAKRSDDFFKLGQSYALLSRELEEKLHINVYSESFSLDISSVNSPKINKFKEIIFPIQNM